MNGDTADESTDPSSAGVRSPRVFISYAHDDDEHETLVRRFYEFLRIDCGINAVFDQVAAQSPQDWPVWMIREMREADFVLCVVSPQYRAAADEELPPDERRGAQWETGQVRELFYAEGTAARARALPVLLPGRGVEDIPSWMKPTSATHYRVDDFSQEAAEKLLRYLTGQRSYAEPDLGPVVNFGAARVLRLDVRPGPSPGSVTVALREATRELGTNRGSAPTVAPWASLAGDAATAEERLAKAGGDLGRVLYGGTVGSALAKAIATTPAGSFVELGVDLGDGIGEVAIEAATLPDGRWPVLDPVVRLHRVAGSAVPALAGPLKILVAVAAPEETRTANVPHQHEAEQQAVMDALEGLDQSGAAQVRILEVSSLAEIEKALHDDQYHVLHLSGHGNATGIELETEDGDPEPVTTAELVARIRRAGRPLPMVFLSSCHGGARSGTGMAAGLVAGGVGSVVAMQTTISDVYATLLARILYRELARPDATPAAALAYARQTLEEDRRSDRSGTVGRPEFAVPIVVGQAGKPLVDGSAPKADLRRVGGTTKRGPVPELAVGRLIGRRPELRKMLRALRDDPASVDEHGTRPGVQLLGIGGIGKSALAGRAMGRLREEGWAVAAVVGPWAPSGLFEAVREAMNGRTLDGHEVALVERLGQPVGDGVGHLNAVAGLLRSHRLLVVLDNAEDNLDEGGRAYKNQAFPTALRTLAEGCDRGRLLVTSRYPLPGFDDLLVVPVLPLSRSQVERLLSRLGRLKALGPADRTMLYRTIGGHPRVLEFVDAVLRGGRSDLSHVNTKLRDLAEKHGVALSGADDLTEAVQEALAAGARDIVLPTLLGQLDAQERETLLQLSVSSLPRSAASVAATVEESPSDDGSSIAAQLRRLVDASLVTPLDDWLFVVHRWTAEALRTADPDTEAWQGRCRRAGDECIRRINAGEAGLDEAAEAAHNYSDAGDVDDAVGLIAEIARMQLPTMTKAAFLGDVLALVPEDHPFFALVLDAEALALIELGLGPVAAERYRRLLARQEHLAAIDPTNIGFQRDLSISYERLGDLMVAVGNGAEAERIFRQQLAIAERLAATDPTNAGFQRDLSVSYNRLGDLMVAVGNGTEAERFFRQGLAIRERLAATDPTNAGFQRDLSISYERLGDLMVAVGNGAEAERLFREKLGIDERLATTDPTNAEFQRNLSISYNRLGALMVAVGNGAEAERLFRQQLAIAERLAATDPTNARFQRDLSISYERLGDLARDSGQIEEAIDRYEDSLAIWRKLAEISPSVVDHRFAQRVALSRLAAILTEQDPDAAARHMGDALRIMCDIAVAQSDRRSMLAALEASMSQATDLRAAIGATASPDALGYLDERTGEAGAILQGDDTVDD